jgi:hypothetical protein
MMGEYNLTLRKGEAERERERERWKPERWQSAAELCRT